MKIRIFSLVTLLFSAASLLAQAQSLPQADKLLSHDKTTLTPMLKPPPIKIQAKSWVLLDDQTGQILTGHNPSLHLSPASLTKIMTSVVVANSLKNGHIHMGDQVVISHKAWRTGGSKTFIEVNKKISVENLLKGMIIQSGNDAAVALAEHTAGSENAFAALMNNTAKQLGMKNSHFANASGLPDKSEYSSAYDLAILSRYLINTYPKIYHWYSEKSFTFNGIKQYNRNRLLRQDPDTDGIKTGHTQTAGYCLAASAKKNGMRLIAVVMGAPSSKIRNAETTHLLNWGFRFYQNHQLYRAQQKIKAIAVLSGKQKTVDVGLANNLSVVVPRGHYQSLQVHLKLNKDLKAPITKGQVVGSLVVDKQDKLLTSVPLIALAPVAKGGLWSQVTSWFS